MPNQPSQSSTPKGSDIKRLFAWTLPLALAVSLFVPALAYADVNDFTVNNFTADYYLTKNDPQGEMRVVEQIDVTFTDYNHGIVRALPRHYKNLPLNIRVGKITSASGAPSQYTTSSDDNDNEILKIGDANRTVTGEQKYTIEYTLDNVVSFYNDHDELYWNVNGVYWNQPFTSVTARLHMPGGLASTRAPRCYAGEQGSNSQDCTITQDASGLTANAGPLTPNSTLTFVAAFPKGYFQAPTSADYIQEYIGPAVQFSVPLLGLSAIGFIWWWKRGRDAKGTGIIVPQYDAPDNMSALEVGTLVDFRTDDRDLTATIIDLAIRKYLRIVETDTTKLLVAKTKTFSLELINSDWTKLNTWEQQLMSGLFGARGGTGSVGLADIAHQLQPEAKSIKKQVAESLTSRGYFAANPTKFMATTVLTGAGIAFFVLIVLPSAVEGALVWGLAAGITILSVFFHFMAARTSKGVVANEHILGLKLYLKVAEKDRIKMLQSPDAPYAQKSDAPRQTVDLFEKLLPYAIVLGVEKEWAGKFKDIYTSPPDWYAGNYAAFNAGYLVGSLGGGFSSSLGASFGSASSSSGSGFGGGGFSGGGGGGGGGGGW